jgi:YHS domain-containing protein
MKTHTLAILTLALGSILGFSSHSVSAADGAAEKPYPLKTCVVSGEKLGSMGKSFVHTHEGREVQFCCKSCLKDFNKDPQKYLKKLDAAAEKPKS